MFQTYAAKHTDSQALLDSINSKYYYYTRTRGLFRICYPKERPPASAVDIYLSPVETHCSNVDYFPGSAGGHQSASQTTGDRTDASGAAGGSSGAGAGDENARLPNDDAMTRLHLARTCVALFVLSFLSVFCAFWTGLSGCWKRSAGAITATAILMLITCLLAAGAMGLWHTVEFFEKEKVVGEEFYQQWNSVGVGGSRAIGGEELMDGNGVFCRCCATTPASRTTGRTLWPGLVWPRVWWRPFCCPVRPCVCAASAKRRSS